MNTLFIINPAAGRGRSHSRWEAFDKVLRRKRPFVYDTCVTTKPGDAEAAARTAAQAGYDCVIAVGGDGTFNEIVNGAYGSDVILGILPFGTGNDLSRALGMTRDHRALVSLLSQPRTVTVNVARLGQRYFIIAAGVGFDGIVAHHINTHNMVKRLGPLGYAISALSTLRRFRPARMVLEIDGQCVEVPSAWMVAVANCPFYGGGMRICPSAAYDDDWLDVCVVSNLTKPKFVRLFPSVYGGTHVRLTQHVRQLRGRRIVLHRPAYMLGHVDGELVSMGEEPMQIELTPWKARVLAAPSRMGG